MICWECGQPLAHNDDGSEIYQEYTDPIGNVHKLHRVCFKHNYAEQIPGIPLVFSDDDLKEMDQKSEK